MFGHPLAIWRLPVHHNVVAPDTGTGQGEGFLLLSGSGDQRGLQVGEGGSETRESAVKIDETEQDGV